QHLEEQPQINRVADDAVDAARGQHVPRLDRDQPAEPVAEHENRPNAQRATREEENNAQPAAGVPIEGPDFFAVRVSRQIRAYDPDQPECEEDPAVGAIFSLAGTEFSSAEEPHAGKRESCERKDSPRWVGEEGDKPAPAENGKPEIAKRPCDADERHFWCDRHGRFAPAGTREL